MSQIDQISLSPLAENVNLEEEPSENPEPVEPTEHSEEIKNFADENRSSFCVKACTFAGNLSMHGVRYIVARDTSTIKR